MKYLDQVVITLRNKHSNMLPVIIDVYDNSLSRKWLKALNLLLKDEYHLEKNYCFFGFVGTQRNAEYIISQINQSIAAINAANLGYQIDDYFSVENTIVPGPITNTDGEGGSLVHDKMNQLHRYFEDLQGVSGNMSVYYNLADTATRWHIRQLNLLCHEYESLVLSMRKSVTSPEWMRPSQLMCWLNAPRFELEEQDYELFGIESLNRPLGGVFVGVNKAVGKHHWEVFVDEAEYNPNYIADNLTTSTMRSQCEAAGDFDIEWANNPGDYEWQKHHLQNFRTWLINNNFDPDDKSLTIGHPQIGQVNLLSSFGTTDYKKIWEQLANYQDVYKVQTRTAGATYTYRWSDPDYQEQQTRILK
jgi:hypothetical protein